MSVIIVTYDVNEFGKEYRLIYKHLDKYNYCKSLNSVWLLDTEKEPSEIRDELKEITDNYGKIFIVKMSRSWSGWSGQNFGCADWLNNPKRNW